MRQDVRSLCGQKAQIFLAGGLISVNEVRSHFRTFVAVLGVELKISPTKIYHSSFPIYSERRTISRSHNDNPFTELGIVQLTISHP
jgi:hypothetical protein